MFDRFNRDRKDEPEVKVEAKVRERSKVKEKVDTDTPFLVFIDNVASVAIVTLALVAVSSIFICL